MHENGGMQFSDEWVEQSGIRHYVMTEIESGYAVGCIVNGNGHFLAHFSIGKNFPEITLIEGPEACPSIQTNARLPVANSKTYALGKGNEIDPKVRYADLMNQLQPGIADGRFPLISRRVMR